MEPLKNLLDIYENKHKVLFHYLPDKTTKKLENYEYNSDNNNLFLNDRIFLVKKSSGLIEKKGIIIKITNDKITIKANQGNLSFNIVDHYIFKLPRKNKSQKNNRKFYEELLKSL